ncbi:HlyD family type I secretion periplasmic adaptor subunit [Xenophilus sp. Marseille-Q4582]|uniref:HlyD family type I secretion periplasmic adaptor subunit n=1 Tax=Xenophilus sp. Marseille-Q4582 TaxID=2866600 RepID=UPI001CE3D0CC|nr:HlyD family type I secretion periplasmic adaptor subunit [Xenophilus sp. Marseille-Q4582]
MNLKLPSNAGGAKQELATPVDVELVSGGRFDERRFTRWGWLLVLGGFVGFMVWAAFAPLDQGTPVSGTVIVGGNRQAVQHPTGGIIEDILVSEGSVVKQGDVLVRMNATTPTAQANVLRSQLTTGLAVQARLLAERDGLAQAQFAPELKAREGEPEAAGAMALQRQLLATRRAALQSDLSVIEQTIRGLEIQLATLRESNQSRRLQEASLKAQLADTRELSNEGYVPRNRLMELDRQYSQLVAALADDAGMSGRIQSQILEQKLRLAQRRDEYQKEVRTQLTDIERDVQTTQARLKAAEFELAHAEVRAPAGGIVVGINVFTRGGVVGAGQKLMDVVPQDQPLEVEGQLPVHLVDKVHPGLPVDLSFPALNRITTPNVPGELTVVSADRLTDEATHQPYYKVKAKVTPEGVKALHNQQIRPGMPVEIFVISGERSFLNYLIKPLRDRAARALTEE